MQTVLLRERNSRNAPFTFHMCLFTQRWCPFITRKSRKSMLAKRTSPFPLSTTDKLFVADKDKRSRSLVTHSPSRGERSRSLCKQSPVRGKRCPARAELALCPICVAQSICLHSEGLRLLHTRRRLPSARHRLFVYYEPFVRS